MTPEESSRRQFNMLALAAVWLTALWMWRRALRTFFTADDLVAIARAAGLEPTPSTFRPLSAVVAARLQYAAFGLAPAGYHAVNLGLHLLAAAGVYALALQLMAAPGTAAAAALLFACSGIAFTPLHAASGVGDLLACVLLVAATVLHLAGRRRDRVLWLWLGAAIAALAVLAKESAVAWPLFVISAEWLGGRRWRVARPALVTGTVTVVWLAIGSHVPRSGPAGAYSLSFGPADLLENLATYLRWCIQVGTPMRDVVAGTSPSSWPAGLALAIALALAISWERRESRRAIAFGSSWLLAFLLPALPLAHHTYLYYLYIPWVGGAIAVAGAGAAIARALRWSGNASLEGRAPGKLQQLRGDIATVVPLLGLSIFLVAEARGVGLRERATLDSLPADPTLKQATLLEHAISGLRDAALPPGTPVGFVNPVPRAAYDLPSRAGHSGDAVEHTEYVPLEEVVRGGRAFRLFVPGLIDSGFAVTVPATWEHVECFLYEQRGWLRHWGNGQEALMRQGEMQAAMGRWAQAETSFVRVRSLGDTLPAAVCGEAVALASLGREREAAALADMFSRRWPTDARVPILGAALANRRVDPRLIQPFDRRLSVEAGRSTLLR
ncbi:MAG: hypothetical protein ACRENS_06155 [Candidatus Eiseniibacteriota bacterium]